MSDPVFMVTLFVLCILFVLGCAALWPQKRQPDMEFQITITAGSVSKVYKITVPSNFTTDQIEELLTIMGAVEPHVEITGGPHF